MNSVFNLFVTICLLISITVHADTEVIPFAGYRISGEFKEQVTDTTLDVDDENSYGLIINIDYEPDTQLELFYSNQSSALRAGANFAKILLFDIDIEYFHLGGLVLIPINEKMNSFIGAGIGVTRFSPDISGYSTESEFSYSLSGGIKQTISEKIGLRLGIRFYGTTVNDNSTLFCGKGVCAIHFSSNLFTQYEANAGLIFRF